MDCATVCKWNKRGECVLFVGQSMLECKYRKLPQKAKKTIKTIKTKGIR